MFCLRHSSQNTFQPLTNLGAPALYRTLRTNKRFWPHCNSYESLNMVVNGIVCVTGPTEGTRRATGKAAMTSSAQMFVFNFGFDWSFFFPPPFQMCANQYGVQSSGLQVASYIYVFWQIVLNVVYIKIHKNCISKSPDKC